MFNKAKLEEWNISGALCVVSVPFSRDLFSCSFLVSFSRDFLNISMSLYPLAKLFGVLKGCNSLVRVFAFSLNLIFVSYKCLSKTPIFV